MAEYKEVRQYGRNKRRLETPMDEALQRLHAENERLRKDSLKAARENERLSRALNRAVGALKEIESGQGSDPDVDEASRALCDIDQMLDYPEGQK